MKSITRARFNDILVEVLDQYESGGIQYASIKACEGMPFIGGNKWPVRTACTIARVDALQPVEQNQTQTDNLLGLALRYSTKQQWHSGEVVYLWGTNQRGAFLKEEDGFVRLSITKYPVSCCIFYLTIDGWRISENLKERYKTWAKKAAREMIK